ncbi:aminotransferase class IV family protein [Pseudomonas sp. MTM4]|uniref:aminotransferase class IV family protein n=1 Tax=unclassified Pseudomonas TaxID=196821 RepID=UPI0018D26DF1|nr:MULTISPECIES: aminotransferase class IV family protein [unclassified Pseudomonas]MBC8650148.1 aminotransferase class IV family protein [Pseudomonas sp. MT4]QXY93811.1 aminotransferase class IV family protein [Pseudomonas sp. MTM4]
MATQPNSYPAIINGQPVTDLQLSPLAFAGFAHFTAMQVRDAKVKALDLHLDRLRNASLEFFGRAPSDALLRSYIRMAIQEGTRDQSLTVTVFSPHGEFTADSMDLEPGVLVRTAAPSDGPKGPLRLSAIAHQRPLAAIKHVGEVGKTYYLHQAIRQGFDDAAFLDDRGHLSEGTIWNLVFWDGATVIWPRAEMLKGTMMAMVQRQLARLEVPQRHEFITLESLNELSGAAVMNSWTPGIPVTAIASHTIEEARPFIELLHKAYEAEPADFP